MQAFVVLASFAVIVGSSSWLIVASRRHQKEQDFERKVQARKLGWVYDGIRERKIDYRFAGTADGIEWSMEYDSDRGEKSPTPKAYWQSANVRAPQLSLVIIGRKRYLIESGTVGRVVIGVVTGITQAMGGGEGQADKTQFYEAASTLAEGSVTFRERYAVAVATDMPRGWLDEELQSLLLNWPKSRRGASYRCDEKIEVTLGPGGLRIIAQQMPEDFAFWNHLARLGHALARQLGQLADR
ncbi:MAG: hypothetical protein ABJA83_11320 [Burkholderiaceae bacterium]